MVSSGYFPWFLHGVIQLVMKVRAHQGRCTLSPFITLVTKIVIAVIEMGDDINKIVNDKALMLINHQSTSDVPLIMAALDGRSRNIMWIMDRMFMKTNFGLVSWFHKDFFISSVCSDASRLLIRNVVIEVADLASFTFTQGKDRREQSLQELTLHLSNVYMPCQRTWILLFPEGGFLRKRREISRKFALQNNLPTLHHTTIPRVGAVQNVVATIGPARAKTLANGNANASSRNARCVSIRSAEGSWVDAGFSGFVLIPCS